MQNNWSRELTTHTGFRFSVRPAILGVLQPGTTLLVTRDSIRSAGTGTRLTVITADAK